MALKKKSPTKSVKKTKATTKPTRTKKKVPIKATKKKSTKKSEASSKSAKKKSTKKVKKVSTKTKVKSPDVKRAKQPRFQSAHLLTELQLTVKKGDTITATETFVTDSHRPAICKPNDIFDVNKVHPDGWIEVNHQDTDKRWIRDHILKPKTLAKLKKTKVQSLPSITNTCSGIKVCLENHYPQYQTFVEGKLVQETKQKKARLRKKKISQKTKQKKARLRKKAKKSNKKNVSIDKKNPQISTDEETESPSIEPLNLDDVLEKHIRPIKDVSVSPDKKAIIMAMDPVLIQLKASTEKVKAIISKEYYSAIESSNPHAPKNNYVDLLYIDESHPFACKNVKKFFPNAYVNKNDSYTMPLTRFRTLFPRGLRLMQIEQVSHKNVVIGETMFGFWVILMDHNTDTLYMTRKNFNVTNQTKTTNMPGESPITTSEDTKHIVTATPEQLRKLEQTQVEQEYQQYANLHRDAMRTQRTSVKSGEELMAPPVVDTGLDNHNSAAVQLEQTSNKSLTNTTQNLVLVEKGLHAHLHHLQKKHLDLVKNETTTGLTTPVENK